MSEEQATNGSLPTYDKRLALFGALGLGAMFLLSAIFHAPEGQYFTICGFKNLTNLPCPGCGLTHSFCAVGKGDIAGGFGYNLLGPPLFLLAVAVWLRSLLVLVGRTRYVASFDHLSSRVKLIRNIVILFGVYGAARIAYLLVFEPSVASNSPLAKLIAQLTG
ncbi:MAG TPA: DUF2752 domain-containing protein [Blastocatellia bacterium]|nr:DUF2752 domain-containing protein [Blastocatellia bacterium]